jgi:hypothetical protein
MRADFKPSNKKSRKVWLCYFFYPDFWLFTLFCFILFTYFSAVLKSALIVHFSTLAKWKKLGFILTFCKFKARWRSHVKKLKNASFLIVSYRLNLVYISASVFSISSDNFQKYCTALMFLHNTAFVLQGDLWNRVSLKKIWNRFV